MTSCRTLACEKNTREGNDECGRLGLAYSCQGASDFLGDTNAKGQLLRALLHGCEVCKVDDNSTVRCLCHIFSIPSLHFDDGKVKKLLLICQASFGSPGLHPCRKLNSSFAALSSG